MICFYLSIMCNLGNQVDRTQDAATHVPGVRVRLSTVVLLIACQRGLVDTLIQAPLDHDTTVCSFWNLLNGAVIQSDNMKESVSEQHQYDQTILAIDEATHNIYTACFLIGLWKPLYFTEMFDEAVSWYLSFSLFFHKLFSFLNFDYNTVLRNRLSDDEYFMVCNQQGQNVRMCERNSRQDLFVVELYSKLLLFQK